MLLRHDDSDERQSLRTIFESMPVQIKIPGHNSSNEQIIAMVASQEENHLYAVTKTGQLIETKFNFKIETLHGVQEPHFSFVMCPFHSKEVTGLDVCIRKQLIATCSRD